MVMNSHYRLCYGIDFITLYFAFNLCLYEVRTNLHQAFIFPIIVSVHKQLKVRPSEINRVKNGLFDFFLTYIWGKHFLWHYATDSSNRLHYPRENEK